MLIACCLKSKVLVDRLKNDFNDFTLIYIESMQMLQDSIHYNEFDAAIVDEKIEYKDDAIELFKKKEISGVIFKGNLEAVIKRINEINESRQQQLEEENATDKFKVIQKEVIKEVAVVREVVREKEVEVVKEMYGSTTNHKVGIINLNPSAGATYVGLNLAAMISSREIITSFIQPPNGQAYKQLDLDKKVMDFYSIHHEINEGKRIKANRNNLYKNISFIVPSDIYEISQWTSEDMLKLIYTPFNSSLVNILDIGSSIKEDYMKGILSQLDVVICVADATNNDLSIEILRELESLDVPVWTIFNKVKSNIEGLIDQYKIDKDYLITILNVSDVSGISYLESDSSKHEFDSNFSRLIKDVLPVSLIQAQEVQSNIESVPKREVKKQYITLSNNVIGVIGVESGVGATHNSLILANVIARQFKVAVMESNNKSLKHIHKLMENDKKNQFTYKGVDYYYNIDVTDFLVRYKTEYDFLVIDFGTYEECSDFEEFVRCDRQYVVGHAIDWKIQALEKFISEKSEFDKLANWIYLVPFMEGENLEDFKKQLSNIVLNIGTISNPFLIDSKKEQAYKRTLGIEEGREQKEGLFKKIFSRRGK